MQKEGNPGVQEQLIREAREGKGDLAVLWLDLANAYSSIPQKLEEAALVRHHVLSNIKNLIMDYSDNFMCHLTSTGLKKESSRDAQF